ncbi:MAG: hypothetical protein H7296_12145 [Bacteroidia bacterium]|nr:hypothetical protein [Bacteroidia bacterium]
MEKREVKLDRNKAIQQWESLKTVYQNLQKNDIIEELLMIDGARGCEDMVFCANQTFPWQMPDGEKLVVMSKMRHLSRQAEVPYFEEWFLKRNYKPLQLKVATMFEGMGDVIPHPGKRLLYGGYGQRSDRSAYTELTSILNVPVIALKLVNPNFYHLDTCFVPLTEHAVMLCEQAFTAEGMAMIRRCFEQVYLIPEEEAVKTFCLNAHVIPHSDNNKNTAIIQLGSKYALAALIQCGYHVYEIETSEFMKSGGSVFCMKMMVY